MTTFASVAKADNVEEAQAWSAISARADMRDRDKGPTLWVDAQVRHDMERTRAVFRPAVAWRFNPWISVWAGYLFLPTFEGDAPTQREHRAWQDLQLKFPSDRWTVALRTRIEQRFFDGSDAVAWRLRERLEVAYRFTPASPVSVVVSDEVFLHANEVDQRAAHGFDQNRLFLGLGWALTDAVGLQTGYMHQRLDRTPDRTAHVAFASLAFRHRPPTPPR